MADEFTANNLAEMMTDEEPALDVSIENFSGVATTFELVKSLYKDELGRPFSMTPGQNEIFDCIFKKQGPQGQKRVWIATHTQFGKSDTVSMAVLTRVATFGEKWVVIAPSQSKARIITSYLIKHIFDNEFTMARFKIEKGENSEQVRRERSKNRLTFDCGNNLVGEVFVLSAESRLTSGEDAGNALMGFGSPNVVMDEAALISDNADAKAMRMVSGFTGSGHDFVVKIGNPFNKNHFLKAYEDPDYYKINIDWERGLKEKNEYGEARITEKFIKEMRQKPFFRVLFENKFPEDNEIDLKNWSVLFTTDDIDRAMDGLENIKHIGELRLGQDVARGGANDTVWAKRSMNYMEILAKSRSDNLTETAMQTLYFMREEKIKAENVFIDDIGVGGGVTDALKAEQQNVRGVNVGLEALENSRFMNIRAEAYWRFKEWIKKGGKLNMSEDWYQLTKIKTKPDRKGRLKVMSKDEMRSMGIDSPDVADAGMLTFVRQEHGDLEARRTARKKRRERKTGGRGLHCTMGGY